jgi:hypothetical protein
MRKEIEREKKEKICQSFKNCDHPNSISKVEKSTAFTLMQNQICKKKI